MICQERLGYFSTVQFILVISYSGCHVRSVEVTLGEVLSGK
jgi:hypothetical protein